MLTFFCCVGTVSYKMSGTDGEEDYKALQAFDNEGDDDLGLFGDLSSFEGLALEEDAAENEITCPQCL